MTRATVTGSERGISRSIWRSPRRRARNSSGPSRARGSRGSTRERENLLSAHAWCDRADGGGGTRIAAGLFGEALHDLPRPSGAGTSDDRGGARATGRAASAASPAAARCTAPASSASTWAATERRAGISTKPWRSPGRSATRGGSRGCSRRLGMAFVGQGRSRGRAGASGGGACPGARTGQQAGSRRDDHCAGAAPSGGGQARHGGTAVRRGPGSSRASWMIPRTSRWACSISPWSRSAAGSPSGRGQC